jgi:hypothetical protein
MILCSGVCNVNNIAAVDLDELCIASELYNAFGKCASHWSKFVQ